MPNSTMLKFAVCLAAGAALHRPANAQPQAAIPIRSLGPIVARSADSYGYISSLRGISGGKVIVNDVLKRRVWMLDSTLTKMSVIADSAAGSPMLYPPRGVGLIRFAGDTTLYVDTPSGTMLKLGPAGGSAGVLAPPKALDIAYLVVQPTGAGGWPGQASGTVPGLDAKGRLVYRGMFRNIFQPPVFGQPPPPRVPPDTAPLVRGSFDTRKVDTLAVLKIPVSGREDESQTPAGPKITLTVNPLIVSDDWAVLSDGSVAIVRAQDYHIDWIDPDGSTRSTPRMPFDWRRLTDAEKQYFADSALTWLRKGVDSAVKNPPPGQKIPIYELRAAPINEIPDYLCPIGAVRPDLDGNVWILPTTSLAARSGRLYDVVNRKGEIIERVQFPPGRALEGFGPGGIVYLSVRVDGQTFLERARLR